MVKLVFSMLLRGPQKFINSVFKLAQWSLPCSHHSCISKLAKAGHAQDED
ncbi:Mobile element protein (plasmid) [Candidatus Enterovibrio altilux]|uniref:Mobile element protein n=1 Tax=Candidatus Enterovibrio altilux TaxID=1927128 RepID=A0A291BAW3_9GAMM|nr:Mobile element protein [Candidatus Enterovibrio luxaltus]